MHRNWPHLREGMKQESKSNVFDRSFLKRSGFVADVFIKANSSQIIELLVH
jgi:hypothetical protein